MRLVIRVEQTDRGFRGIVETDQGKLVWRGPLRWSSCSAESDAQAELRRRKVLGGTPEPGSRGCGG